LMWQELVCSVGVLCCCVCPVRTRPALQPGARHFADGEVNAPEPAAFPVGPAV